MQNAQKGSTVSIKVNDEIIAGETVESVRTELLAQDRSMSSLSPEAQLQRAEEAAIERVLVRQAAQTDGPPIRAVDIKREVKRAIANAGSKEAFEQYLEQSGVSMAAVEADIELRLKIDGLLDSTCAGIKKPDDGECRAYYDAHPEQFMTEEHVRASHIVRHCAGNALEEHAAHAELKRIHGEIVGGKSFESFSRHCSDCPDDEGDLGYFGRGMMVPEFEEVVFNMEPGEVSDVFKTPFGLHIAKVLDRIPAAPRPFDEVKEDVRQYLYEQAENACIDAFTADLKQRATIERSADTA